MLANNLAFDEQSFQAPLIDQNHIRVWLSNQLSIYKYSLLSEYAMECESHILTILYSFLRLIASKKQDEYVVNKIDEIKWLGFI